MLTGVKSSRVVSDQRRTGIHRGGLYLIRPISSAVAGWSVVTHKNSNSGGGGLIHSRDEQHVWSVTYPSTMSSPYFTGTLVEAVVEMFSCSGEYIGLGGGGGGGGGGRG